MTEESTDERPPMAGWLLWLSWAATVTASVGSILLLWALFIVPLGAPALSLAHAAGLWVISLRVRAPGELKAHHARQRERPDDWKTPDRDIFSDRMTAATMYVMLCAIAYGVSLLMGLGL